MMKVKTIAEFRYAAALDKSLDKADDESAYERAGDAANTAENGRDEAFKTRGASRREDTPTDAE